MNGVSLWVRGVLFLPNEFTKRGERPRERSERAALWGESVKARKHVSLYFYIDKLLHGFKVMVFCVQNLIFGK